MDGCQAVSKAELMSKNAQKVIKGVSFVFVILVVIWVGDRRTLFPNV